LHAWIVTLAVMCVGCTNEDRRSASPAVDVGGQWCGLPVADPMDCRGDEVFYAELAQAGGTVTGQFCEAYGRDCYDIAGGVVAGRTVTFHYEFDDSPGIARVDVDVEVSSDEASMTGTAFSTACDCELDVLLFRL
jgi:hypothetical protein